MKFKLALAIVISFGACTTAAAQQCYGSSSYRTCTTSDGSTYTTQRIGNSSYTNGYNSQTGSSWNQSTQRIGNSSWVAAVKYRHCIAAVIHFLGLRSAGLIDVERPCLDIFYAKQQRSRSRGLLYCFAGGQPAAARPGAGLAVRDE